MVITGVFAFALVVCDCVCLIKCFNLHEFVLISFLICISGVCAGVCINCI